MKRTPKEEKKTTSSANLYKPLNLLTTKELTQLVNWLRGPHVKSSAARAASQTKNWCISSEVRSRDLSGTRA